MSVAAKNSYPRAMPLHTPDELAAQVARLSQQKDELAAQAKRLQQSEVDLSRKAARLHRWTVGLIWACAVALLISAGAIAFGIRQMRTPAAAPDANPASVLVETPPPAPPVVAPKQAPSTLPALAAKPESANAKADFLEALGGLSATHLYQSHLNIGLLADGVESETYTVEDAVKNLKSVTDLMKLVDGQLGRLAKSSLDAEDQDSLREIQVVARLLHAQADALRAWATGDMKRAEDFQKARAASWQGLTKVMGLDS